MYTNQQNILQKQMAEAQCEEKRYAGEDQTPLGERGQVLLDELARLDDCVGSLKRSLEHTLLPDVPTPCDPVNQKLVGIAAHSVIWNALDNTINRVVAVRLEIARLTERVER